MNVYIEYVIIDNLVLDYLLLKLTFTASKGCVKKGGFINGAMLGTFFAILMPFINLPNAILFFIKIISGMLMLLVCAKFKNILQFFKLFSVFLLLTFAFGGAIYGIFSLLNLNYSILYNTASIFPVGLILIISAVIYKMLYRFFCVLYQNKLIYPFVRRCEIIHNGQKIYCSGFIDSGNQLVYKNFNGVCIASKKLVNNLLNVGFLCQKPKGEMILNTVSGKTTVKIYEFDKLVIYYNDKPNIIYGVNIGVLSNAIELSEQYDLILSGEYA